MSLIGAIDHRYFGPSPKWWGTAPKLWRGHDRQPSDPYEPGRSLADERRWADGPELRIIGLLNTDDIHM